MGFTERQRKEIKHKIELYCSSLEKRRGKWAEVAKRIRDHVDDIISWYETNGRPMEAGELNEILRN